MPEIVTGRDLRHSIERTITDAENFLFIVSPYISLDDDMIKAFKKIPGEVKKCIIYRTKDASTSESGINDDTRTFLNTIPNLELVAVNKLHAKIFMNEDYTVISTMNLTKSSNHNYEIGTDIENAEDYLMFEDTLNYIIHDILLGGDSNMDEERLENIIPKQSFVLKIRNTDVSINGKKISEKAFNEILNRCNVRFGYCIRCGNTMKSFSPLRPLCPTCFKKWNQYKNPNFEEKHCHKCATEIKTTINNPLCVPCEESFIQECEVVWQKLNLD
ncbi:hypothetical protein AB9K32_07785 [Allomuricauda sp. XS_ASV26]|uniref:hypothetical protein n=1 Tax=Allomuricauda sp. XS_ASV26 TaxID=3241292 RepID=UPI003511B819